jgi:2-phosphosulfolactate phosphatase
VRVAVALTAEEAAAAPVAATTAVVIDVLRASTTIIAALASGCAGVVPVGHPDDARARLAALPPGTALIAGERRGEPLQGFHLGNSPLEFTPARVAGKTVVLTTSNGTRALLAARRAAEVGVGALVNLSAAARWAAGRGRDLAILCAGERGAVSLEDHVCAGLLIDRLVADGIRLALTPAADAALALAAGYRQDPGRLAQDSSWARHLVARGRGADVAACLAVDATGLVPRYVVAVDKVLAGSR